jgi:hypothetical protein
MDVLQPGTCSLYVRFDYAGAQRLLFLLCCGPGLGAEPETLDMHSEFGLAKVGAC